MAPYPTQPEIAAMITGLGPRGGSLSAHLSPNVNLHIMGHSHGLKNSYTSADAVANEYFAIYDEWADWSSVKTEIRHVFGGGDESWACVEVLTTGKSKKGKQLKSEWVFIIHFDEEGKIAEGRVYVDSAHFDDHFSHHREN